GTLSIQSTEPDAGYTFNNLYDAKGSITLKGKKTLHGRDMEADEFHFTVTETDDKGTALKVKNAEGKDVDKVVARGSNAAASAEQDADITFSSISYSDKSQVGKHYYTITEDPVDTDKGLSQNTEAYKVVVDVSDNGDGTLKAEATDRDGNAIDPEKDIHFINTYSAEGSITLKGSKTLVGRDMKDGEFTFTVREQNEDGSYKKAADGTDLIVATGKNEEAKNGQAAAIDFTKISYKDITEIGTHTYVVTEDPFQGAAEDGSKNGLQANSQSFKVVVRVTDDGQGNLTASAISGTDADGEAINPATDIAFINTYEASGDHSFYGTKTVAGRDLTPGEDYQFQVEEVITDEDGKENRVEVSTGHLNPETIVGNHGDILFGTLHYTLADVGTHTYKIHEVIPADQDKMAGITYDKTEYTEIVTVSDKGDGSLEVVAKDADGNLINSGETKTYNFTNTYQNVAVRFTGSKTLAGGDIASYPGVFRFDLVNSDGQVIDTAKNDATGRFTFAPIYYEASDVGEHTYTIVEENAGRIINGIKYDDSEIPVTVTVENRAGKLVATGQVEGDEIAFHNEKLSEITVQKNWADDQNAANARPQQITVDLLQNEQVVRSAVLTGATDTWTYTFKDLTPGTYKVRERSDSPYYEVSYDKQILDLTDENGQAKDETVTITNTFERTVDLVAYKDLMGQALNDGQFRFVLHRNSDGDDTSHDLTTTNRGDGSISFYDVTYDPNGYTMYEVAEQSKYPHITFDEHNSIATGLRFDPEGNPITQEDGTALYTFKNVYRPIVLRVQKRSKSAPFDPLVGATYGLYRYSADGNDVLVEAQLSDSNGYMYYGKIEPGVIYYFKEISAPAGHEVDPYAGKHFQVKYTENGNIAVYDEDGNPDTTYGDITTMEDKTEGYRTTEIIKEKDSLDEIQANEKQSRYAYTGNGVDAVAIADKGAFPEGTTMVVTPLTGDRLAEVETLLENNVGQFNTMAFYDITFTDADGKEVEPAFGDVDVTIQPEVGLDTKGIELKNLKLIHLIDDGDPESTVKTVSLVTGSIAAEEKDGEEKLTQTKITSKSFSVFGLIDPKDSTLGNNYLLTANGVGDFVSKLKVAKLDTQGNFIPNATLDVYTFDPKKKDGIGERVIRWTTAEGCQYLQRILNVETRYVLVETNAPDGYAIADNIIFSIGKYDSSITCYTLKDGKLTASEKETQLHTNGSELIMVDDPITVMNKTDYKIIPQVKELTRDREITVPGAPKTGDQPIIPLVVILLAGIIGFAGIEIEKRRKNREEKQK
ncbi:MAG: FctA domain-containing protein, partial [Lachnospiraceae bacterium]|nr:FctA domain-containing protein [Lachnospiraceae bacterium]